MKGIDAVVCLGCGKPLGSGADACSCPPPSIVPSSAVPSGPYRMPPTGKPCPRCGGRLAEVEIHEADVLDCVQCGGFFLPKTTIEELSRPDGKELRFAFPRRERVGEPAVVRYLTCPCCGARMNRVNFGKQSGVIVDVCKEDGVWFDAGELDAVIAFVEKGGLERAKERAAKEHAEENERLRAEWRHHHDEAERASFRGRRHAHMSEGERELLDALFRWFTS